MRAWGMVAPFCLQLSCPGESLPQPALESLPESGGQESGAAGDWLCPHRTPYTLPHPGPSHEVAALGSILVYLALGPGPSVRPACQLSRSLQSTA